MANAITAVVKVKKMTPRINAAKSLIKTMYHLVWVK